MKRRKEKEWGEMKRENERERWPEIERKEKD